MIPPRVSLDNETRRFHESRALQRTHIGTPARRPFSRMAPRKPDTQWVHFRRAQGQNSDVGALPRAALSVPYGPPTVYARAMRGPFIGNPCDLLSRLPLHLPVYRCPSIISAPPADFDHQFDYGCHSRRTRHFGASHSHASLPRDRTSRENNQERRSRPGYQARVRSDRRRVFPSQPQSRWRGNEELAEPPLPGKIPLSLSTKPPRCQIGDVSANIN